MHFKGRTVYMANDMIKDSFININNKHIYIYGIGEFAKYAYSTLKIIYNNIDIKAFIVTQKVRNELWGVKIVDIEDFTQKDNVSGTIIVAMKPSLSCEVEKILKERDIDNYVILNNQIMEYLAKKLKVHYSKYRPQKNKIFFESFMGKVYGCNPKYISEEIIRRNLNIEMVWSFVDRPKKNVPDTIKQVERFSRDYFDEYYSSYIYISNSVGTLTNIKTKSQYYIETWHGVGPFKKCGNDAKNDKTFMAIDGMKGKGIDVLLSGSRFNDNFYRQAYGYNGEILKYGFPRNDIFFGKNKKNIKKKVCDKYNIKYQNKIILYAPTFRGDKSDINFGKNALNIENIIESFEKIHGGNYICLMKSHTATKQYNKLYKCIDVTDYEDTQEILVAADILISDYSSIIWDFALQKKPVFLYQVDAEEYKDDRGFYVPPSEWPFYIGHNNEEMIEKIEKFDNDSYVEQLNKYFLKYGAYDNGHASEKVVDRIIDVIGNPKKYGKE